MQQITPRELDLLLRRQGEAPLLLDVREPWEFGICHIKDSRLIPMRQIPAALAELEPERPVVVICHHGFRSEQVALYLEHRGFRQVYNLRGGVAEWAHEVEPSMPTY